MHTSALSHLPLVSAQGAYQAHKHPSLPPIGETKSSPAQSLLFRPSHSHLFLVSAQGAYQAHKHPGLPPIGESKSSDGGSEQAEASTANVIGAYHKEALAEYRIRLLNGACAHVWVWECF